MVNPFSKAKDTYALVKKAKAIQKRLKETEIVATSGDEEKDEVVSVTFNGEQRMVDIQIAPGLLEPSKKRELERAIINVVGQAISKAQALAAEEMKAVAGDLNLPPGLGI